jgi:hypothetical protein
MTAEVSFTTLSGDGRLHGQVSDAHLDSNQVPQPATWTSELTGDVVGRAVWTELPPQLGSYTIVLPGEGDGAGYATVTLGQMGKVALNGSLADGTAAAQRTLISPSGYWPLFVNLYQGKGSLLGWATFTGTTTNPIAGTLVWTRPPLSSSSLYPTGVVRSVEIESSRFARPTGSSDPLLDFTYGLIDFSGGDLGSAFEKTFIVDWKGRVTNPADKSLALSINSSKGLFGGTVVVPGDERRVRFKGALLQSQNAGYGFLLGTNRSSSVLLGSQ